jgi:hypothetical protein
MNESLKPSLSDKGLDIFALVSALILAEIIIKLSCPGRSMWVTSSEAYNGEGLNRKADAGTCD